MGEGAILQSVTSIGEGGMAQDSGLEEGRGAGVPGRRNEGQAGGTRNGSFVLLGTELADECRVSFLRV